MQATISPSSVTMGNSPLWFKGATDRNDEVEKTGMQISPLRDMLWGPKSPSGSPSQMQLTTTTAKGGEIGAPMPHRATISTFLEKFAANPPVPKHSLRASDLPRQVPRLPEPDPILPLAPHPLPLAPHPHPTHVAHTPPGHNPGTLWLLVLRE